VGVSTGPTNAICAHHCSRADRPASGATCKRAMLFGNTPLIHGISLDSLAGWPHTDMM
jgi:hypothetical protein